MTCMQPARTADSGKSVCVSFRGLQGLFIKWIQLHVFNVTAYITCEYQSYVLVTKHAFLGILIYLFGHVQFNAMYVQPTAVSVQK